MGEHKQFAPTMGIGDWEPQWCGNPARYLYTALHRAERADPGLGVLLVSPLFHEQPRSRRLMTELASGLAAAGLPTMRFDFFGTGDSAGSGAETDFQSMCEDLSLVERNLRAQTGVRQVAVLACRGGALPVMSWLQQAARPELVILWEPILDGLGWLADLEHQDAAERCSPHRYRLAQEGVAFDQQLMGVPVSQRLRADIAESHVTALDRLACSRFWTVLRPGDRTAITPERTFTLPADVPMFGDSTRMDSALFVSPQMQPVVDALGHALRELS